MPMFLVSFMPDYLIASDRDNPKNIIRRSLSAARADHYC